MKRVSLKVAQAIAKAGYWCKYGHRCEVQENVDSEQLLLNVDYSLLSLGVPTYLEVWLWLWREKNIVIEPVYCEEGWTVLIHGVQGFFKDPEEAIIAAIEHLVENDLIK